MQLAKVFVVFVAVFERMCLSSIVIKTSKTDGFGELEDSAINILMDCYVRQNKTILLVGDYPGDFIRRLVSQQSFSLVLLDDTKRAENNNNQLYQTHPYKKQTIDVVVVMSPSARRSLRKAHLFMYSIYDNSLASILILGWASTDRDGGCEQTLQVATTLNIFAGRNMFNVNLMCRDEEKGILIYGFHPYGRELPAPWRMVTCLPRPGVPCFSLFVREYREQEGKCENLDFDKTKDLNGFVIMVAHLYVNLPQPTVRANSSWIRDRRMRLQGHKRRNFIYNFISYVNGSARFLWKRRVVGKDYEYQADTIDDTPFIARGLKQYPTFTYPHAMECIFLVTQFRGNMTQLEKLYAVIDSNCWIGMYLVYLITLIFFKFFLRQSLIAGVMNLCRLTCNCGLPAIPANSAPRIYIGCLLFFVVTIQGIYAGLLASLLTHECPVRQVNSLQDVTDLDYTVYAEDFFSIFFDDAISKGRFRILKPYENCIPYVLEDPTAACTINGAEFRSAALKGGAHVSTNCIADEYLHNRVPWRWVLIEKLDMYLLRTIATGTVMPLSAIVEEKRMIEEESQEMILYPEVMTLGHLSFAFVILGIGLACASIVLIAEIMFDRYQRRVTTTRVIVLSNHE